MARLEDHVIVVTGAARGIGRSIAEATVAEGAAVVVVDVDDRIEQVSQEVGAAKAVVGDIVDGDVARAALTAAQAFGTVTGLVNNAALVPPREKLLDMSPENWQRAVAVNLEAPITWCRTFLAPMLDAGHGSIVNIASIEANLVGPAGAAYHMTKAGLLALTRNVAVEYGRQGVRSNSISPGSVRTPTFDEVMASHPGLEDTLLGMNYSGRIGSPEEVAACAVFLLSDECRYANGADFVLDGGRIAATLGPQGALG